MKVMNKMKQFLMVVLAMTIFVACEKEDNEPADTLTIEDLAGKWLVEGSDVYYLING